MRTYRYIDTTSVRSTRECNVFFNFVSSLGRGRCLPSQNHDRVPPPYPIPPARTRTGYPLPTPAPPPLPRRDMPRRGYGAGSMPLAFSRMRTFLLLREFYNYDVLKIGINSPLLIDKHVLNYYNEMLHIILKFKQIASMNVNFVYFWRPGVSISHSSLRLDKL